MHEGSRKAIFAAFFANLGIAIAKFTGFLLTSSASLLAESAHSLADTGNQALLLLGGNRSKKTATGRHPFGFGRERYFWAFVVALILFSMGGVFALYEGIQKLVHPHEGDGFGIAIGILMIAFLLESYSLNTAIKEARLIKKTNQSWWGFIREAKQPELPIVLLEDVGAEIGLALALFGVLMSHFTHEPRWDAIGSASIGVLLITIAIILAIEMKSLLIGESASENDEELIRSSLTNAQDVLQVIHLRTEHIGPEDVLVAAKIEFSPHLSMNELAVAIDNAEVLVRQVYPRARIIFIEPDIARPTAEL
ncbi:MAG: cation diffusion facilitator family transporter [Actinomycetes bacterium]|jgi:cation diffusion facilitator family transporter